LLKLQSHPHSGRWLNKRYTLIYLLKHSSKGSSPETAPF
jgi:hypothetical protein